MIRVYAGPTVTPEDIRSVLPDADVRVPVARGDLLAGPWSPGDTAILIDGFFRERRAVGHKEILRLLSAGVDVVGTASMGALRAAELCAYGMRGLGAVFEMYDSGEIDGDDEVGVVHGPAERGYPAQTVALVNLRYGCREGVGTGLVPADAAGRIIGAAAALPFARRAWSDLAALLDPTDQAVLGLIEQRISAGEWDVKRLDAMAALRAVAAGGLPATRVPSEVTFTGISRGQLLHRTTSREYAPGRWMSDLDVLDAARLFEPDYPIWHEEVLTGLLGEFSGGAGVEAYARDRLGVLDSPPPPRPAAWLTPGEAAGDDVSRLVMLRVWPLWQSSDWRPAVLARLRAMPLWVHWASIVAEADEAQEQARYRMAVPPPAVCANLFLRHWQRAGSTPEVEIARRGFTGREDLGATVRRFFAYDVAHTRAAARAVAAAR